MLPLPEAEESLLLRILAQGMVLVGILATDVAAETQMSFWAIPLSLAGASWSWYSRHKRNVAVKFCIAIGMLLALAAFFVGLRAELNDTRLVLAELLIQLQVLHSFDLPRRKDLGYSMVIGLILIGVASTLSQTMTFGLLLLLFLAMALPVLVLDYRSRLGLAVQFAKPLRSQAGLSPRQLGRFLLITVGLGLTIFACLPRLPGYQLRTFPVSPPLNYQQEFNNTQIINPGYVRMGDPTRGSGGSGVIGQGNGFGPGKLNEEFYYGFNTRINQNLRGQLKPKIVMRVRSQAEGFWRVMAFDRYLGQGWEVSRNSKALTLSRPNWSYQFYLPRVANKNKTKEIVQTYTILSTLPNLIPALAQPKELYFPTQQVALDPEGALRSPLELMEGLTYTVISEVPYRDRTLLRSASTNYPESIRKHYLDVPPAIRDRVQQKTEELLTTSPQTIEAAYDKALFLAQALKQQYTIQTELPFLEPTEDLVASFLFKYQGGYSDHFPSTLTIMLRSIGIPTRLSVGFRPGEFNPFTGLYVVRNTDAYAVTEVYFPGYGWFAFDPIPGHEVVPPSIEENQTFTVLQRFWKWVAGWLPSPVTSVLSQVFGLVASWVTRVLTWLLSLFSQGWMGLFAGILLTVGTSFLGWIMWQGWRNWRYYHRLAQLPPVERLYQQMLDWLTTQGVRKQASETPLEFAQQVWRQQNSHRAEAITAISQAYIRWRYGGESVNLEQLRQQLQALKKRRR